jgi:hypothetical protein
MTKCYRVLQRLRKPGIRMKNHGIVENGCFEEREQFPALAVLGYIIEHPHTRHVGTVFSLAVFERAQLVNGPRIMNSFSLNFCSKHS